MHKNLRPLYPYLWKYRRGFAWSTLSVLLMNGIWVLFPQVIGRAIDDLTGQFNLHELLTQGLWAYFPEAIRPAVLTAEI